VTLTEKRHRAAIVKLERAERALVKAFARWQRLRAQVRRYDVRADRAAASEYDQFASLQADRLLARNPER
jgi:hypothetical protein